MQWIPDLPGAEGLMAMWDSIHGLIDLNSHGCFTVNFDSTNSFCLQFYSLISRDKELTQHPHFDFNMVNFFFLVIQTFKTFS